MNRRTLSATVAAVALAAVTVGATFTALCGNGTSCSYNGTEPRPGYQTFEKIRQNFNALVAPQYWTGASNSDLTGEKNLGALSTGLVINTAGVPSAYAGSACAANMSATSVSASGALTCGATAIYRATVTLTNQQVKDLPTTAVTLVAAQGAGTQATALLVNVAGNTSAGAYTNINAAASMVIAYQGGPAVTGFVVNDAAIAGSKTRLTDLIGTTTNRTVRLSPYADTEGVNGWGPVAEVKATSASTNVPIVVSIDNVAAGVLTGGNAANTLTFTVIYVVL